MTVSIILKKIQIVFEKQEKLSYTCIHTHTHTHKMLFFLECSDNGLGHKAWFYHQNKIKSKTIRQKLTVIS